MITTRRERSDGLWSRNRVTLGATGTLLAAIAALILLIPARKSLAEQITGTWTGTASERSESGSITVTTKTEFLTDGTISQALDLSRLYRDRGSEATVQCLLTLSGTWTVSHAAMSVTISEGQAEFISASRSGVVITEDVAESVGLDCPDMEKMLLSPRTAIFTVESVSTTSATLGYLYTHELTGDKRQQRMKLIRYRPEHLVVGSPDRGLHP